VIVNASPLIILGKTGRIALLKDVYHTVAIAQAVFDEVVVRGKGMKDAAVIASHINSAAITVRQLMPEFKSEARNLALTHGIDIGEAETIALALQEKQKEVVIDERDAREAAKAAGIRPVGTLGILLRAHKKGILTREEAKRIVREMQASRYRLSAQVLLEFWDLLDKAD
jgi:uncharacterized protein